MLSLESTADGRAFLFLGLPAYTVFSIYTETIECNQPDWDAKLAAYIVFFMQRDGGDVRFEVDDSVGRW